MEWFFSVLALTLLGVAYWLGTRDGAEKSRKAADEAFEKMVEHAQEARKAIRDADRDELLRRVRGARSNGAAD